MLGVKRAPAPDEDLQRALAYPYERPNSAFVYHDGELLPLHAFDADARTPVLAIGSNAAPLQLARKFAGHAEPLPVTTAVLADHAAVYAAHITSYGAVPATLGASPRARARVHITWLNAAQLDIMHRSEGLGARYGFYRWPDAPLHHVQASDTPLHLYLALSGQFSERSAPLALAALRARGCRLAKRAMPEMLDTVRALAAPENADVPAFVRRLRAEPAFRQRVSAMLAETADVPLQTPALERLA